MFEVGNEYNSMLISTNTRKKLVDCWCCYNGRNNFKKCCRVDSVWPRPFRLRRPTCRGSGLDYCVLDDFGNDHSADCRLNSGVSIVTNRRRNSFLLHFISVSFKLLLFWFIFRKRCTQRVKSVAFTFQNTSICHCFAQTDTNETKKERKRNLHTNKLRMIGWNVMKLLLLLLTV